MKVILIPGFLEPPFNWQWSILGLWCLFSFDRLLHVRVTQGGKSVVLLDNLICAGNL